MIYDQSAFPIPVQSRGDGMTFREYVAAHIAAALAGDSQTTLDAAGISGMSFSKQLSCTAVALADALIKELQR